MSDTLYGGRRFRTLNILDEGVREGLAIEVDTSLSAARVIRVLAQVVAWRGRPQALRLDNGPELLADRFVTWSAEQMIELRYIQPGKPTQNAFIERFNRSSIGPIAPKSLTPMCLSPWSKSEISVRTGYSATTRSGPMRRWRACHPPPIGPNWKSEILLSECLLDGGAYNEGLLEIARMLLPEGAERAPRTMARVLVSPRGVYESFSPA
jgi:transposase InsO family protein